MKATPETYRKLQALILKSEGKDVDIRDDILYIREMRRGEMYADLVEDNDFNLERVLQALGKKGLVTMTIPMKDGLIQFETGNPNSESHVKIFFAWTLCLPAHEQEEETLQALIDILTQKSND